jgi:hypothetical protein
MIKQHQITGLLYLCKTSTNDPKKYLGSGLYWKRHLKSHGKNVHTIWMKLFEDQEEIISTATFLSNYFDVVKSKDRFGNKKWANLEIENGIEGMPAGTNRGDEFKKKSKINNAGQKNPSFGSFWWTDGVNEIKSRECPTIGNWTRGRSKYLKNKISNAKNNQSTGKKNGNYDHRLHKFMNVVTKESITMTKYEFCELKGLCHIGINRLVRGVKTKYKDWVIAKE